MEHVVLCQLGEHVFAAFGRGGHVEFAVAAQDARKDGRPDFAILGVHGELIEKHVAGEAAHSLRIGGQADDPHAIGQTDFKLLDARAGEIAVVKVIERCSEGLAVLPGFDHQFARLPLAGAEENLRAPPLQPAQNAAKRFREALARLPSPARPLQPLRTFHVRLLIRQQINAGSGFRRDGRFSRSHSTAPTTQIERTASLSL